MDYPVMAYGTVGLDTLQSSTTGTPTVFKDGNGVETGTLCRAWVNFNGTGTVAIRASFNVSSITDNGTGDYTVNFTNAMPDANYAVVFGRGAGGASRTLYYSDGATYSTTAVRINAATSAALDDPTVANVAIFR